MGSEFDVDAMIKEIDTLGMKASGVCPTWWDIRRVLEAGRVPAKPEIVMPTKPCGCLEGHKCPADKKNTIEISRVDAEYLIEIYNNNNLNCIWPDITAIANRIKQALGRAV